VAKELCAQGFKTNARRLHRLRDIARAFSPSQRHAGISWDAHAAAGCPENLDMVIKALADSC
jgi:hypothetical protein